MKLHIFNPENDMALANGSLGYTAPANIRSYRKKRRDMPKLWADAGDVVWDGESNLSFLFADDAVAPEICPWGWSPALVHELELAGVPRRFMPDKEWLERLRSLSSRTSTVPVQLSLGVDACVCRAIEEVERCALRWGRIIMKSPWSSSGKGLMHTDNLHWREWVLKVLHLQGAVIVERFVEKEVDFAMEFWMKGGKSKYMGLNIFQTDSYGHFLSNSQGSEQEKTAVVSAMLKSPASLDDIRAWYVEHLPELAPWYSGPVGVDMVVMPGGMLHPCIEINWRMTMGMVSVLGSKQ